MKSKENPAAIEIATGDRDRYRSLEMSLCVLAVCLAQQVQGVIDGFGWREQAYEFVQDRLAIDLLLGDEQVRVALEAGENPREIFAQLMQAREVFESQRRQCLLY